MDFKNWIGIGVAGNFTGHLEQAGEATDFVGVAVSETQAPKGIFPFYVPAVHASDPTHYLHVYPISSDTIRIPPETDAKLQIEPEVGLLCNLRYTGNRVTDIFPYQFSAYNDCSIRRPGAKKISEKKNWGPASKGISATRIDIDRFARGGILDSYRLTCFLQRGGKLHLYGVDSPVRGYSYFYGTLLDWLVAKCNEQKDAGPLESISDWLRQAGCPSQAIIGIGATKYTEFGETNFLQPGDESIVALYDEHQHSAMSVENLLARNIDNAAGLCVLRQKVVA